MCFVYNKVQVTDIYSLEREKSDSGDFCERYTISLHYILKSI